MPALHPKDALWNSFLDGGREAASARADAGELACVVADVAHTPGPDRARSWRDSMIIIYVSQRLWANVFSITEDFGGVTA